MATSLVLALALFFAGIAAEPRADRPPQLRPAAALLAARARQRHSSLATEPIGEAAAEGAEAAPEQAEKGANEEEEEDEKESTAAVAAAKEVGKAPAGADASSPVAVGAAPAPPEKEAQGEKAEEAEGAKQRHKGYSSSVCMCVCIALLVSCCCCAPGAQFLAQRDSNTLRYAGVALSAVAVLVPLAAIGYCFYAAISSGFWKGGVAAVGTWCGVLCLGAIVLCVFACCQLTFGSYLAYQKGNEGRVEF